ncbi:MAG TPA: prepilin-type N-terminal cleavage/methylation domain-containing protein, partial [Tepidisphaeraceae bacterium]
MNLIPFQPVHSRFHRRGFTLVEVMISIAIALVLILGIAQIFSMAQRTTGAGTQILAAMDTNRGFQQMLLNDARGVTNAVGDSPGLFILSYPQAAFRNKEDQGQDLDGDPRTPNDPANPGQSLPPEPVATIDDRIHRNDVFGFFARGKFTRRTGEGTNFPFCLTSPTTSEEAFIWYGHLALPDNTQITKWNYTTPGANTTAGSVQFWNPGCGTATTNQNNFYASDWILGRQVMLLSPRVPGSTNYRETHIKGTSENPALDPLRLLKNLTPATANDNTGNPLYASRYDLADTSIAAYRNALATAGVNWWQGMSGLDPTGPNQTRYDGNPFARKPGGTQNGTETQQLSAAVAQMSPIFVRGCSQFIVEFAGDYVTQDINGTITAGGSDGQIDYYVDNNGARQIRWYGFMRDTAADGGPVATASATVKGDGGVMPVGMTLSKAGLTAPASWLVSGNLAFERVSAASYVWPGTKNTSTNTNGLPVWYVNPYVCAWGPDTDKLGIPRPKMIRITIGVDDPTGHL